MKIFVKKRKRKSNYMFVNFTKISEKMKKESLLRIEKDII